MANEKKIGKRLLGRLTVPPSKFVLVLKEKVKIYYLWIVNLINSLIEKELVLKKIGFKIGKRNSKMV